MDGQTDRQVGQVGQVGLDMGGGGGCRTVRQTGLSYGLGAGCTQVAWLHFICYVRD